MRERDKGQGDRRERGRRYAHPSRDDASRWDNPRLGRVVVGRREALTGHPAQEPGDAVDEDVGDDACDDTVRDTMQTGQFDLTTLEREERTCK